MKTVTAQIHIPELDNASLLGLTIDDNGLSVSGVSEISAGWDELPAVVHTKSPLSRIRNCDHNSNLPSPFNAPHNLIGRESEQALLLQAYLRICNKKKSEIIMISGASGSGKSALARSLRPLLDSSTSFFLEGKFDQFMRSDLYSAISTALSQLVELIVYLGHLESVKKAVQAIFNDYHEDLIMLTSLIPNLYQLTGIFHSTGGKVQTISHHAFGKLKYLCRRFLQAVVEASFPVVLFLDDIQWASWESIEFIESLTKDEALKGLLLVLTCRTGSPVCSLLSSGELDQSPEFEHHHVASILVDALTIDEVDAMFQEMTGLADKTLPLSRIIHDKTEGNPYHVIHFVEMLRTEGFLVVHKHDTLSWDIQQIQSETNASDNVVRLVCNRIEGLSPYVQRTLVTAACLGFRFQLSLLSQIMTEATGTGSAFSSIFTKTGNVAPNPTIIDAIQIGCEHNLVEKVSDNEMKFTHDRVQQSLLSLLQKNERPELHRLVGNHVLSLYKKTESSSDFHLFLAVDQLNHTLDTTDDQAILMNLCRLNQQAADRAMLNCAFHQAADFLDNAVEIAFKADLWNLNYALALEVLSTATECAVHAGRFAESEVLAKEVIRQAKSIDDKLRVYEASIDRLNLQSKFKESIDLGLAVLKELGEPMPREPNVSNIVREFSKVYWMVRGKSDEQLLSIRPLNDVRKQAAMNLLKRICVFSFISLENELFSMICIRTLLLSLKHGLCGASAFGFAAYGMVLSILKKFSEGYRFGQIAMTVLERYGEKEDAALPTLIVSCFLKHRFEAMRSQRGALARATAVSIEVNEMCLAPAIAFSRLETSFCVGCPLEEVLSEGLAYIKEMGCYASRMYLATGFRVLQTVANLRNPECNPLVLTGDFMNEDEVKQHDTPIEIFMMYRNKLFLAFFFQNWEMVVEVHTILIGYKAIYSQWASYFASDSMMAQVGVAYCRLAGTSRRSRQKRAYLKKARCYLSKLNKIALNGSSDAIPGAKLLHAEYVSLNEVDLTAIAQVYDAAIEAGRELQYLHYAAFACERAAAVLNKIGDTSKTRCYLQKARTHYMAWNATAKVAQMEALMN